MLDSIQQAVLGYAQDDVLERDTPMGLEFFIFPQAPIEELHNTYICYCVPLVNTSASPNTHVLREIAAAYCDAQEAIPFGRLIGEPIAEGDLFHLAPRVALKVRGLRASLRNLKKAADGRRPRPVV